ncbi:anaphase-promoting complex subunit 2-like [Pyrus x bretschneideri]|uniref:anaphase-promoting complex subunit 2-like n=1 Tax=Pyrus x bretschneideri TaxID=225117 RepID=UPI00202FCD10|nr:anaphase-promoting complex subunit 2-like [Pyrus x bretschneideri]
MYLGLLTNYYLIMQRGLMKSRHLVNYYGRKVLVLSSWTSKDLAAAIWVPVDVLNRRVNFWISKVCLINSSDSEDHVFTRMEGMVDTGKRGDNNGSIVDLVAGDEEGESSVASVEDQLRKGMTVYECWIICFCKAVSNLSPYTFLQMFCIADPPYDKTLLQLQSFLPGLVSDE